VRYSDAYHTGFEFLLPAPLLEKKIEECAGGLLLCRAENGNKEPFGNAVSGYWKTRFGQRFR
jgi:hypothetical protein